MNISPLRSEAHPALVPGFSRQRTQRMRDALQSHVQSGLLPGFVAWVHHRGREHVEAVGYFNYGGGEPMRRDTIFRLASMTKPITAVGAMILLEECKIRLDDPIDEWLPELKNRRVLRTIGSPIDDTVPARRPMTVRDLFTLRSGYGELDFLSLGCPLQIAMSQARLTLAEWPFSESSDEFMKRLGELPLAHQPGERWLYHTSLEILGVLISRVSGKTLGEYLRERIFEPLEMKDTGFWVQGPDINRLPPCYGRDLFTDDLKVLHPGGSGDRYARAPVFESGGGGLVSTIDDLRAFGLAMLSGRTREGEVILSKPSIKLMATDQLTSEQKSRSPFFENFWNNRGWGLGVGLVTGRSEIAGTPGHFGWDGAFGTSWFVDPEEQLAGVFLTQRRPDALKIPEFILDFWTSAYQLVEG